MRWSNCLDTVISRLPYRQCVWALIASYITRIIIVDHMCHALGERWYPDKSVKGTWLPIQYESNYTWVSQWKSPNCCKCNWNVFSFLSSQQCIININNLKSEWEKLYESLWNASYNMAWYCFTSIRYYHNDNQNFYYNLIYIDMKIRKIYFNLYLSILLHYVTFNVTVSISMQHNICYLFSLFLPHNMLFYINNPSVCQRKNKTKHCSQNNY
jgi:hypothetical protein